MKNSNKRVLLLEPNYSNKYPPIGLMKISTYHKMLGYDVVFYKGDLKKFVIERIADKCITDLQEIDDSRNWFLSRDIIIEYIAKRKKDTYFQLNLESSKLFLLLDARVNRAKDYYWNGLWKQNPEWDRVFVTTLFTFYWDITVETIEFAKLLVKPDGLLMVGGVLASIQPKELYQATGIKPYVGVLNIPGQLDEGDTNIIDNLPLDYSILDEIEYKYPMNNAYYGYTTRGCIRKCPFCAVPTLEPDYNAYIPLKDRIDLVRDIYGEQKDLLLMDNNVLASDQFNLIVDEIIECGFGKNGKYKEPDRLAIAIRNLENGFNDRAFIRKSQELIMDFYKKLKGDDSFEVYKVVYEKYHINKLETTTKENLLLAYEEIKELYKKHFKPSQKLRFIDFNQGVDARLFNQKIVDLLSKINIRPLRIAFDDLTIRPKYEEAIRMSAKAGIKDFSNYLLYNFRDKPVDLYKRLQINIDLCEELNVNVYSFPMKYHPIRGEFSHNRDYIGEHWNRKYIRAVQAILNSTKGKIGRGASFFYKAFGDDEEQFLELLEMPETFILYRFFFEWLDGKHPASTSAWRESWDECMLNLSFEEKEKVLDVIHRNEFKQEEIEIFNNPKVCELLNFYTNYRKDIITPGTELYKLKQEYDKSPTIALKRKR